MMNQELNRVRYRQSDSDEHDVFGEAAYCKVRHASYYETCTNINLASFIAPRVIFSVISRNLKLGGIDKCLGGGAYMQKA